MKMPIYVKRSTKEDDIRLCNIINRSTNQTEKLLEEINLLSDYFNLFTEKMGSKVWPSNDPEDSPFNTFTCNLCGWEFKHRIFGAFNISDGNPRDEALKIIMEHLVVKHGFDINIFALMKWIFSNKIPKEEIYEHRRHTGTQGFQ